MRGECSCPCYLVKWLHLDQFAPHVPVGLIATHLPLPDLALEYPDPPAFLVDLHRDQLVDAGLQQQIERLFSLGADLSFEQGQRVPCTAVEAGEDRHNLQLSLPLSPDLKLLLDAGAYCFSEEDVDGLDQFVVLVEIVFLGRAGGTVSLSWMSLKRQVSGFASSCQAHRTLYYLPITIIDSDISSPEMTAKAGIYCLFVGLFKEEGFECCRVQFIKVKTYSSDRQPMQADLVSERLTAMRHKDQHGWTNLYDHLTKMLPQLQALQSDKIGPIANLEYISEYVKKYQFHPMTPPTERQLQTLLSLKIQYPPWLELQAKLREQLPEGPGEAIVQHFEQQSQRLFTAVGVGFGKEEASLINCALKRLVVEKKAERVRFWGKILTQGKDYLIAQGSTKYSKTDEPSGDVEKLKEGANYNTYWVTQDILSNNWQQLPLVTPEQVRCSRFIKKVFSGELNKPFLSSPPFNQVEKYLLKAQIVRITHNCQVAPKGLYAPLEDNPDEIQFGEEFKMPEFGQLANLQNWVHVNPYILKMGRGSYYIDPSLSEEQKEEQLAKLGENDPKVERLKAVNEDKGLQKYGLQGCWTTRVYGNTQLFNNVGKDQGTTSSYGVVTLRNPHWPGWHTVASGKQFGSIYIGYGLKSSQAPFHPTGPEDIAQEAEDVEECHQPNPRDPPDELQPDSDDENKKPQDE